MVDCVEIRPAFSSLSCHCLALPLFGTFKILVLLFANFYGIEIAGDLIRFIKYYYFVKQKSLLLQPLHKFF